MPRSLDTFDLRRFLLQNLAIKKQQCIKRLVLRRGSNVFGDGQMCKKRSHGLGVQVEWMTFTVKENEALDPTPICFFSAQAQVPEASYITDLIEQLSRRHG